MSEQTWVPLVGMQIVEKARRDRIRDMAASYPKRAAWAEAATADILEAHREKERAEIDRTLTSIEDHIQKISDAVDRSIRLRCLMDPEFKAEYQTALAKASLGSVCSQCGGHDGSCHPTPDA